jgi:uncharacterized protein
MASIFDRLLQVVVEESEQLYGERLAAVAVFGSVGRGTMRGDSDIDLLLAVDPLPAGRIPRIEEFAPVEQALAPLIEAARGRGIDTRISAVIRTPEELRAASPLMFDMTEDARILHDPHHVLADALDGLRHRLGRLGARRVWRDGWWYWDLKPDYRPGEVFEV